jgi:phosphate acetyltransferase
LPDFKLSRAKAARHDRLIAMTKGLGPIPLAVIHPCDTESLKGALLARDEGLAIPTLIGPEDRIRALAEQLGLDLAGCEIVNVPHSHAAAEVGVALARDNKVEALMKGSAHTDELMSEVVAKNGLRTARRISHVFLMDVPTYPRYLLITDAAVNVSPTLETKVDIVQNAIDLAVLLGVAKPKVAILAAVETVNPKMPATLDAAALCKMADRGQIRGGFLDGPLALDNAISMVRRRINRIELQGNRTSINDNDIVLCPSGDDDPVHRSHVPEVQTTPHSSGFRHLSKRHNGSVALVGTRGDVKREFRTD